MDKQNQLKKFPDKGNFSASSKNSLKQDQLKSKLNNINMVRQGLNNPEALKQNIAKEGIKAAANVVGGPTAGAVVEKISKTELGQKVLNKATNVIKNPLGIPGNEANGETNEEQSSNVIKFGIIGATAMGLLIAFIIVVVIVTITISPLIYMNQLMDNLGESFNNFGEELGNFLTFRGWCDDSDCTEKEKNNFYKKIDEVYIEYMENKNVELNTNLIVATLTYSDPFITNDDDNDIENLNSSELVNFKKSKRKINDLASHMVTRTNNGFELDIDSYREYLEDSFVRKFYFDNKQNKETDILVERAVEDIFTKVEMFEKLNDIKKSESLSANNINIQITNCNGDIVIDEVTLYEYLQGVLYAEGNAINSSEEFLKVMAIVAKNYLYSSNNIFSDSTSGNLRIANCKLRQLYCSVNEGCHNMEDGTTDNSDTYASGANENGQYYLNPLTNDLETLEKIKRAIDSTLNEFVVKNGKFVLTQYHSNCSNLGLVCDATINTMDQSVANEMIQQGQSYIDVLNYFYDSGISNINISNTVYPLDIKNNYITSAYGWRVHPINSCCKHHYGTDIAAPANDPIYSIADGVIVENEYNTSYGNYVIVGHGSYDETTGTYEYYSLYAHQIRKSPVKVSQRVSVGEKIGSVGSTGTSTGNHLHIEIYEIKNNIKYREDPETYFKNVELEGFVGGSLYNSLNACMKSSGKGSCN